LIFFYGGLHVKGGNIANAAGNVEPTTGTTGCLLFWTWHIGGQQCQRFFWKGRGIGGGNFSNTTAQCRRLIIFLDVALQVGQQCRRLIIFLGGCGVGGGNVSNAAGNAEGNHQCRRLIVFCGVEGGQQRHKFIVFKGEMSSTPWKTGSQTSNAADSLFS